MQDYEAPEFMGMWMSALEMYDRTPSTESAKMAFRVLQDLALADIRRAIGIHIADPKAGHYPIKPADVRRIVEGDPDAEAEHAWSRLLWAIEKIGPYKSVAFDDPILQGLAHEMGGWSKLNHMDEYDFKYLRHNFIRSYTGYRQRRATPPQRGVLRNLFGGMEEGGENVVFLGDQDKAREIAQLPDDGERCETVRMDDLRGERGGREQIE